MGIRLNIPEPPNAMEMERRSCRNDADNEYIRSLVLLTDRQIRQCNGELDSRGIEKPMIIDTSSRK